MPKITISQPLSQKIMEDPVVICSQDEFLTALQTLDVQQVEKLNYTDQHFEQKDVAGLSPIAKAAIEGNLSLLKLLVALGDTPKRVPNLLHLAIQSGNLALVEYLVDSCFLLSRDAEGDTALHIAVRHKHLQIVKFLLSRGVNVEAKFKQQLTPLMIGIVNDDVPLIRFLLEEAEAKLDVSQMLLQNTIAMAWKKDRKSVVLYLATRTKILLPRQDANVLQLCMLNNWVSVIKTELNADPSLLKRILKLAIENNRVEFVLQLLEERKITDPVLLGELLCLAAQRSCWEVIPELLSRGALLTATEEYGYTALHYAAARGSATTVELLLKGNADVYAINHLHQTPLICAIRENHLTVVWQFLVGKVAATVIDFKRLEFRLSLCELFAWGNKDVLTYIFSRQQDCKIFQPHDFGVTRTTKPYSTEIIETFFISIKGSSGKFFTLMPTHPALTFAFLNEWWDVFPIKFKFCTQKKQEGLLYELANIAIQIDRVDLLEQLLQRYRGAIQESDDFGLGSLRKAIELDKLEAVRCLLANAKWKLQANSVEMLYLAFGLAKQNPGIVSYLLQEWPANITDANGNTILHLALKNNNKPAVEYFIEQKVDANVKNRNNETPLTIAIESKRLFLVKIIVEKAGAVIDINDTRFRFLLCCTVPEIVNYLFSRLGKKNPIAKNGSLIDRILSLDVLDYYVERNGMLANFEVLQAALLQGNVQLFEKFYQKINVARGDARYGNFKFNIKEFKEGHFTIIKFLFEQGTKFSSTETMKIILAAAQAGAAGKPQLFDFLMTKGINPSCLDDNDYTALHFCETPEAAQCLLEWGADITIIRKGFPVFYYAENEATFLFLLKQFLQAVQAGKITQSKATELITDSFMSSVRERWERISWLLASDVTLQPTDLEKAFSHFFYCAFSAIEEHGTTIKTVNRTRFLIPDRHLASYLAKAMITAGSKTDSPYFQLTNLLRLGIPLVLVKHKVEQCGAVDLELSDGIEGTALCVAAARGCLDIVEYLLQKGANPAACNAKGNNLLHFAVVNGWDKLVTRLVTDGMDPALANAEGCTPLHLAAIHRRSDILEYLVALNVNLEAYSPIYGTAICAAAMVCNSWAVDYLARLKVNLKVGNQVDNSPLHLLVMNVSANYFERPIELRRFGVKVYKQPVDPKLDYLAEIARIFKFFLAAGFNRNATNQLGDTLLHLIAKNSALNYYYKNTQLFFILLSFGRDSTIRNKAGRTAYEEALFNGNTNTARWLETVSAKVTLATTDTSKTKQLSSSLKIAVQISQLPESKSLVSQDRDSKLSETKTSESFKYAPLGTKSSRKWNGSAYSIIKTKNHTFCLLPGKERLLGQGEFGKVKQAIELNSRRKIAVKVILISGEEPEIFNYIQNEVTALKKMERYVDCCSLITTNYLIGKTQIKIYLFQELLPGLNFERVVRSSEPSFTKRRIDVEDSRSLLSSRPTARDSRFRLNIIDAFRAVISAAADLARLHKQGIAHVDLALRNVVYDQLAAECRLVDYNISVPMGTKHFAHACDHTTPPETKEVYGLTPAYDVFLLGQILDELFYVVKEDEAIASQYAVILTAVDKLATEMMAKQHTQRISLMQSIKELLHLYDQVKSKRLLPIQITIPDYRTTPSFLLFMDLLENLPESHAAATKSNYLRRCDTQQAQSLPTVQFEFSFADQDSAALLAAESKTTTTEIAENKESALPSLFFKPVQGAPTEPKTGLTRIYIHLNFDGSIQLFKPVSAADSEQLIAVQNLVLEINAEGKLQFIRTDETNPDIAAYLFASMKRFPQEVSTASLCQR